MSGHVDRAATPTDALTEEPGATATATATDTRSPGGVRPSDADRGWRRFGRDVADEAATIADRDDLVVDFPEVIPGGHPAMFVPAHAAISIDRAHFPGIDPANAMPDRDMDRVRYPVGWGLLVHECAHAQHSTWTTPDTAHPATAAAAALLEEARIESRHLTRRPQDRPWLRAAARHLILDDVDLPPPPAPTSTFGGTTTSPDHSAGLSTPADHGSVASAATTPAGVSAGAASAGGVSPDPAPVRDAAGRGGAARTAALILARVDAGVLTRRETAGVRAHLERVLGAATLDALQQIWQDALAVTDDDATTMVGLGQRWLDTIGETASDTAAPSRDDAAESDGTPSDGSHSGGTEASGTEASDTEASGAESGGSPTGAAEAAGEVADSASGRDAGWDEDLVAAIRDSMSRIAAGAAAEVAELAAADPMLQAAAEAAKAAHDQERAARTAKMVFEGRRLTSCPVRDTRDPRPAERQAARRLGHALDTAGTPERVTTRTSSAIPPGRLRMRGALAADAQRSAGQLPTAEPFTRTQRRVGSPPGLRLGIACDVSGSMSPVVGSVASAAWILAAAARHTRVDTTTASLVFGRAVHPIVQPGEHPSKVSEFSADDCYEAADRAIDALNGALGLSTPGAARLLVIVSDGIWEREICRAAQQRVTALIRSGCGVLWLAPTYAVTGMRSRPLAGAVVIDLDQPAATADAIGKTATAALRAATRARR